jgi:ATP-dependent DNA helicase RecG
MVFEIPELLGLSQLHQLRGRVGRGDSASYCLLLYQSPLSVLAKQRLGILRDSTDGFLIAEKDLALRGAGELLGTKQTGQTRFKIADLSRDAPLLPLIASISDDFLAQNPQAVEGLCARWLSHSSDYAEV